MISLIHCVPFKKRNEQYYFGGWSKIRKEREKNDDGTCIPRDICRNLVEALEQNLRRENPIKRGDDGI